VNGRIGRLRCRYLVAGYEVAGRSAQRLDRLARDDLPVWLGEALGHALRDDQAIYLVRRVESRVALDVRDGLDEPAIARRWAAEIAAAILRAIQDGRNGRDGGVVRFADRPEQVTTFVADLLAGTAWDRWYHGAFAHLRSASLAEGLGQVLLEEGAGRMALLGRLHQAGLLGQVLAVLDPATVVALLPAGQEEPAGEEAQVPFAAAVRLGERLGLWPGPAPDGRALFRAFLATDPPAVDWRDSRGLTFAVAAGLRFLVAGGHAHPPDPADPTLAARIEVALGEADWLDADTLRAELMRLPGLSGHPAVAAAAAARPFARPTPRQEELLRDLLALLEGGQLDLDHRQPLSPANVLRLQAALAARTDRWSDDPMAATTISRLVTAWASHATAARARPAWWPTGPVRTAWPGARAGAGASPAGAGDVVRPPAGELPLPPGTAAEVSQATGAEEPPMAAADRPPAGPVEGSAAAGAATPPGGPARHGAPSPRTSGPVRPSTASPADGPTPPTAPLATTADLGDLGDLGERVLAKLLDGGPGTAGAAGLDSVCGGAFLLLRAVLDSDLAGIAKRLGYPTTAGLDPPGALLAALALRWAGAPAAEDGPLDPGLHLLTGLPEPVTLPRLRQAFVDADHAGFQAALLAVLARLGLLDHSETIHLHLVFLATGEAAMVAGDGAAGLWPLGVIPAAGDPAEVVAGWVAAWEAATGTRPLQVVCDQELATALVGHLDDVTVTQAGDLADHRRSRKGLSDLLEVTRLGRLGLAGADLTVALTAGALLRVWARWLRRFAASTAPYLLDQFVRRAATVIPDASQVVVELEPRPLDLVLEMAGYIAPLERLPWLEGRRVVFRVRPS
jgi:hypothetical protein